MKEKKKNQIVPNCDEQTSSFMSQVVLSRSSRLIFNLEQKETLEERETIRRIPNVFFTISITNKEETNRCR